MHNSVGTLIIKSLENRTFTGFISVEIVDFQNDIIPIKVLKDSMGVYLESGGQLQLIHSNIPVGKLTNYYVTIDKETEQPALAVHGFIFNDGRSVFDEVWAQFIDPSSNVGFSIGGKPLKSHSEVRKGKTVNIIDALELYEVSVLCSIDGKPHNPANDRARLLSLGHIADQPIPIIIKMVLDMPKNEKKIEKEEDKPSEDEETEKEETEEEVEKSSDLEKQIREEVKATAEEMMGGNAALDALRESSEKTKVLEKNIGELNKANESLANQLVIMKSEIEELKVSSLKVEIERDAWKEIFRKNTTNKDTLSKLIAQGNAVITEGGMPPNQGGVAPIITKEKGQTEAKASIDEFFKEEDASKMSDEEFIKRTRAANTYFGGQ